jgi:hypothetical protein
MKEEFCTAHLARTGEHRPVFRNGLCRECFSGEAIKPFERYGLGAKVPEFGPPAKRKPQKKSFTFFLAQLEAAAQFGREGRRP